MKLPCNSTAATLSISSGGMAAPSSSAAAAGGRLSSLPMIIRQRSACRSYSACISAEQRGSMDLWILALPYVADRCRPRFAAMGGSRYDNLTFRCSAGQWHRSGRPRSGEAERLQGVKRKANEGLTRWPRCIGAPAGILPRLAQPGQRRSPVQQWRPTLRAVPGSPCRGPSTCPLPSLRAPGLWRHPAGTQHRSLHDTAKSMLQGEICHKLCSAGVKLISYMMH